MCVPPGDGQLGMVTCGTELGATWGQGQLVSGLIRSPTAVPGAMAALFSSLNWCLTRLGIPARTAGVTTQIPALRLALPTSLSAQWCINGSLQAWVLAESNTLQGTRDHLRKRARSCTVPFSQSHLWVQAYKAGVGGRLRAPACTALTKHHHSQVWALPCSRTWQQGNLCSLSHMVPVPEATWVQQDRGAQAGRAALPQLTAPPNWPVSSCTEYFHGAKPVMIR